jgi:hypothetical protein
MRLHSVQLIHKQQGNIMRISARFPHVSLTALAWLLAIWLGGEAVGWSAVTFTISPNSVSNTYNGTISLFIGGLTNGETVVVQKFLDANTNGVIDAGDLLVQHLKLTDGTNSVIGGVTNFNVPGDLNTATGEITSDLIFQNGDFVQNIIGKYLFKLSSPVGHFSPITNLFTVTNFPYAQKITGTVSSNSTSRVVANAVILLFPPPQAGSHGPGTPVAGTVANNSGLYSVSVPPGTYVPLAFRSNYVANYSASPIVTLGSGGTINTNLTLTNATATISGQIVDTNNNNQTLPGIFVPVEGAINGEEFIAVGFSDTNGNFSEGVISGQWSVGGDDSGLIVHGYVGNQNQTKVNSGATDITLAYPKATALFYGRVTDGSGNPLANIDIGTYDNNNGLYEADSYTDTNGDYVVGAVGGLGGGDPWWVGFNGNSSSYIFSQPDFDQNGGTNISAGQAVLVDFTALPATNYISGNVQYNGANVIGVGVSANATINGVDYSVNTVDTDGNGNYTLAVPNGVWSVNVNCQGGSDSLESLLGSGGNYECPNNQNVTINNGNGTANFIVQANNGIQITTASLPDAQVGSYYNFYLSGSTDNGTNIWTLVDPLDFPSTLTLNSDGEIFGTPGTAKTYNFTVQLSDGDGNSATQPLSLTVNSGGAELQVTNTSLPSGTVGETYYAQLGATGGVGPYTWSLASSNPPPGLILYANGVISGNPTTNVTSTFQVEATDQQSDTALGTFSITINPKPVLGEAIWRTNQFEMLLTGGSNQTYTVQVTTNLISANWTSLLTTNSATANSYIIIDPGATNATRFYRILVEP